VQEVALRAIDGLCLSPPTSIDRLIAAGFLDSVLSLLRTGDTTLQHCALKAGHRLCLVSEEIRKAMGDARFMRELVSVLSVSSKSPEAREMAAESLCALVSVHRNRKRFVQEDRDDVARVLQLLGSGDEEKLTPAKRFLLSTVMRLADSSFGRRKILSSEHVRHKQHTPTYQQPIIACFLAAILRFFCYMLVRSFDRNLEKLAEADVLDAKRIVKRLGGSRLRSIFHGIWSHVKSIVAYTYKLSHYTITR
jgi:hypothetical protein